MIDKPDYTAMTDDELRKVIAGRLGYTEKEDGEWRYVYRPDGKLAKSSWIGTPLYLHYLNAYPDWPRSVDAAFSLPFPDGFDLYFEWTPGKYADVTLQREIGTYNEGGAIYDSRFEAHNRTGDIARALCLVWLQWKDTENE